VLMRFVGNIFFFSRGTKTATKYSATNPGLSQYRSAFC
jgi:hypothetical protein